MEYIPGTSAGTAGTANTLHHMAWGHRHNTDVPPIDKQSLYKNPDNQWEALLISQYPHNQLWMEGRARTSTDRVVSALAELEKEWASRTALAVSLGMGGRWYLPAFPDNAVPTPGNYSLGHRCKTTSRGDAPAREQISSIVEGCEDPNYNKTFSFDRTFQAMFAYDKSDHMLFTYDSDASLRFKLCETKKNVIDLQYNIVADDIQYEDIDDLCGYGSYFRLRILNRLAEFLAKNYTSPNEESACKLLT
ncbi:hypothetical protein HPB50_007446 [Hyalomma asiaticum]|uniref:Uncharacterized protein n=1 Tax=Hyalomma asiaticum TaxID=266040 RepID=A0ACB7SPD7_HYAAI|nr:hypothetical protein HPB50_007446 [Hyalomma asiaticum]